MNVRNPTRFPTTPRDELSALRILANGYRDKLRKITERIRKLEEDLKGRK